MDRICVLCAVYLAFLSCCSAAPRNWSGAGIQADSPSDENRMHQQAVNDHDHILSQLLGDYDKVKAISEGSDCRCKCVVRPLSRSACRRIEEGSATAQDFYTVETITSGPHCKCACVAPPSAVNPCEGEFRLKKLREADKENVKLSAIIDLLEGSFYGLDLLKLHSVTNKLVDRVEKIEKMASLKHTGAEAQPLAAPLAQPRVTDRPPAAGPALHLGLEQKTNSLSQKSERAAAYHGPDARYEERFVEGPGALPTEVKRPDHAMQEKSVLTPKEETPPQGASKVLKGAANGMIIRGMTFYKSEPDPMVADDGEPGENFFEYHGFSGDGPVDLFIEEQLLQPRAPSQPRVRMRAALREPRPQTTSPRKHDDSPGECTEHETTDGGQCQDTLATISEPVTHHTYGKSQGAWMKDPKSNGDKIYVADYFYGNTLLEFPNMEVFKQGRSTSSYKLPYNWIGTGHVVYGGAFYYNRAFSRDIIKYDLRRRYVAAWTLLDNAVFEDLSPWEWRGHSNIDFSVDESGLWILYPALDEEGFLEEVIVLSRLDPSDLSQDQQTTWRTALRRNHYGNCFLVCGVLYSVDSYDRRDAKLAYALDTHTHTQMVPGMLFVNSYNYTTQVDYNPKEGVLYAWDNGHQVTYNVTFAYANP
ncbi:hypothetical protein NHX12_033842 [Muraenolepis orangiensis]|uniref:Olfactomedin-like domain-containing protein n=1 Tax=Muraenolepis orangiensis TaxID=630683 RepID=A0A9Q0E4Q8_9TELE|nr:hypothetical protein NHX12_033842 [Muraenolepis orangiensis]